MTFPYKEEIHKLASAVSLSREEVLLSNANYSNSPFNSKINNVSGGEISNSSEETDEYPDPTNSSELIKIFGKNLDEDCISQFVFQPEMLHPEFNLPSPRSITKVNCLISKSIVYANFANINAQELTKSLVLGIIEKCEKEKAEKLIVVISNLNNSYSIINFRESNRIDEISRICNYI